ncbi:MAG: thioredoxin domain-containing protein, partial [Planctomycetota bacterium]
RRLLWTKIVYNSAMRKPNEPNALASESSPYLLQHANNPVNWMPWGKAAFDMARDEDKPIFLSIGYATCHWCHVMEHESFENDDVAKLINESFVAIKLDREERPDIDSIYMDYVQATTGQGGWPMTVFMTSEQKPFYAGTYFPPEDRMGRAGFKSILTYLAEAWDSDRESITSTAQRVADSMAKAGVPSGEEELTKQVFADFATRQKKSFDTQFGGFMGGGGNKFPMPHLLMALLRSEDKDAQDTALQTLKAMWRGGIHDQIGGGFHRYSTDREWLTPHFEKMLYDQALMINAACDAYLLTRQDEYSEIIDDIAKYVLRDLRDESGAFHSAEDADSEGVEGKFYVWSLAELNEVIGDDAELCAFAWGVTEKGNFHDEATGAKTGDNILHLPRPLFDTAKLRKIELSELISTLDNAKNTLFERRAPRIRPLLDDKVLTDWNGLMIAAMARAGAILNKPEYTTAAQEAACFILESMTEDGRLLHRYRSGKVGIKAFAADYAFFLDGLFELYQATFETRWLREGKRLAHELIRLFYVEDEKLMHARGNDEDEILLAPVRDLHDGAIPSANSAAAYSLVRWGKLLQDDELVKVSEDILQGLSTLIVQAPQGFSYALLALDWHLNPTREIVIAYSSENHAEQPSLIEDMIKASRANGDQRTLTVLNDTDEEELETLIPSLVSKKSIDNKPTAYVCENYTCAAPVVGADALRKLIEVSGEELSRS